MAEVPIRDRITTLFDLAGSVFIALGLGMVQFAWVAWWFGMVIGIGMTVSGGVFLLQSRIIEWVSIPDSRPKWLKRGGDKT